MKERPRVGVVFPSPIGLNDGSIRGESVHHRYFNCKEKHGVICDVGNVQIFDPSMPGFVSPSSSAAMMPPNVAWHMLFGLF